LVLRAGLGRNSFLQNIKIDRSYTSKNLSQFKLDLFQVNQQSIQEINLIIAIIVYSWIWILQFRHHNKIQQVIKIKLHSEVFGIVFGLLQLHNYNKVWFIFIKEHFYEKSKYTFHFQ